MSEKSFKEQFLEYVKTGRRPDPDNSSYINPVAEREGFSPEEIDAMLHAVFDPLGSVRSERNRLLSMCDWTMLPDSQISEEKRQEWSRYRQSLRDLFLSQKDPNNIRWPAPPLV